MEKVLEKSSLPAFFDDLQKKARVVGAVRKGGITAHAYLSFGFAEKLEDIVLDYKTTTVAPKKLFIPDSEALFSFKRKDGDIILGNLASKPDEKRVLLGIHPCDITALSRLDKVFDEVYRDPYYKNKRENTIVVGLTCSEPAHLCFCKSVGSGPDLNKGFDLLMTDIGRSYFVKVGSKSGEKLTKKTYFREATQADKSKRIAVIERLEQQLRSSFSIDGLIETMRRRYNDKAWDSYSNRCVTCGICNMVCPTCHCFAVLDKTNADQTEGKRVRVWDSCHFERFSRMAGGLDLRESKASRFKHRLYDKFDYTPARYGDVFCVGCGRCIKFCQSEIDLRDALRTLQEGALSEKPLHT
ncbi:MAG: 4Fe-4S dicluster domain-containing protein [Chloroflexota bacterium]